MDYYSITLDGYLLMYGRNRCRPDSQRVYVLSNELAKYLGFIDIVQMANLVGLQLWRISLSVKALKRRFK